ncbi:Late transcription elongation factor (VLTF) [Eptesipox virus]|uniref:Late transcription elongation factor OPG087 n=1 Tax=Eptesipox virus TaxID=1329402 RepID=A0A220T6C0_9POXV|nr:Late transcription elongation factor (VLTF) [Eptesipox virus]ASK51257.1 Late transcription elongation factor (VLTF) [Eptesipox virus]
MSFRDLILFNLIRFILLEDEDSMLLVSSLCRSFNIDVRELKNEIIDKRYFKYIDAIFNCKKLNTNILLNYPENIIYELVYLRLYKFSKFIKPSFKLSPTMKGTAIIKDNTISIRGLNEEFLNFLVKEYDPSIYIYTSTLPKSLYKSKIICCNYNKVTYYAYSIAHIITNIKTDIIVTNKCINSLLLSDNEQILKSLFDKGEGIINKILKKIFYSVFSGGQTL